MAAPVHPYSDYGVTLRTLKTARGWLSILLFACVVTQFIGFALMYWSQQPYDSMEPKFTTPSTKPMTGADMVQGAVGIAPREWSHETTEGYSLHVRQQWDLTYVMLVPITQLLGLIAVCSMTLLIYITLQVALVAQAPGVAHITRSLIFMVVLLFMVFPWQYFFANDFPIPGLLYGYRELLHRIGPFVAHNNPNKVYRIDAFLVIARFVFWPIIGMIMMIVSGERFRAGIMLAIGHPLQSMMQPRPQPTVPAKPPGSPPAVLR